MRTRWLISLPLLTSLVVCAQSKPATGPTSTTPPARTQAAPTASVPAGEQANAQSVSDSTPVITINGVCEKQTSAPSDCKTQVTKAQFENMLKAVMPPSASAATLPPALKRERANQMAQLFTVADAAEKSGIQNTPQGQELLKIARMQALAQAYVRDLQQKSKPTDAEIEAYYKSNLDKYDQGTFNQLFVPRSKAVGEKPADEAADKARAEKFRERAVAGEPFDKLEKEAIEGTDLKTPPPTEVVLQKENLPPIRQSIFSLKPGEVSALIPESSGFLIYKMQSNTPVPLEKVKSNIEQRLAQQKFQSTVEALVKSGTPVLNDAYFGSEKPQAGPGTLTPTPAQPTPPAHVPQTSKPAAPVHK